MCSGEALLGILLLATLEGCSGSSPTDRADKLNTAAIEACQTLGARPIGEPVIVREKGQPEYIDGYPGLCDGSGNLLLVTTGHFNSATLRLFSADGAPIDVLDYQLGVMPTQQKHGFLGTQNSTVGPAAFRLFSLTPDGTIQFTSPQNGHALQTNNPTGGLTVLSLSTNEGQQYDETMQLRWRRHLAIPTEDGRSTAVTIRTDTNGHTLVLFRELHAPDTIRGIWVDKDGSGCHPDHAARNTRRPTGAV